MTQREENSVESWYPSEADSDEPAPPASLHLTRIDGLPGGPSALARLKVSRFGKFYFKHLKPIPFVRALTLWLRRDLFPFYVNHIGRHFGSRRNKRWRPLVKLNDYVERHSCPRTIIFKARPVDTPVPDAYPDTCRDYLEAPHCRYSFPDVYVTEVGHASVYGATNLVFLRESVLHHDLYDFRRDFTSEELHGRHIIDPSKGRMRLLLHDDAPTHLAVAANFVDACASNYAHWMTEVLPRIAAFCSVEKFSDVPLIIDDGLHPNILESLALIVGPVREVVALPRGRRVSVDKLYVTSVTGYVPFERRNPDLAGHSHGLFSPCAFELVRSRCSIAANRHHIRNLPQKVYLRRTSGIRKVLNTVEIEKQLKAEGYAIVEPEKLSFLQQVEVFGNAQSIVGSSGAALANLIHSPRGANVVILISKLKGTSYWYWQNMACSSGNSIKYVLGDPAENSTGIHADFSVDLEALNQALR